MGRARWIAPSLVIESPGLVPDQQSVKRPLVDATTERFELLGRQAFTSLPTFPSWPFLLLAVPIVVRASIFLIALLAEPWTSDPNRIIPAWAQILQASVFASFSIMLLHYGKGDRRAWSLGLFILDSAGTLVEPFVRGVTNPSALIQLGLHLRTDAFQAALLWFFSSEFPGPSKSCGWARTFSIAIYTAITLGAFLATMDWIAVRSSAATSDNPVLHLAIVLQREHPGHSDWYFSSQFLLLSPLLLLMPLKLREGSPDDRRRFAWLVVGVGVGLAPLIGDALLATLWSDYVPAARPYWRIRGTVIVVALTAIPASAAYASLVQKTLSVRLVVRAALQYVLARSVIRAVAAVPVVMLAWFVLANRERPVAELLRGAMGVSLGTLALAGAVAAAGNRRLLSMLDRAFFREELDGRRLLSELADQVRQATTVARLCETVSQNLALACPSSLTDS